MDLRSSILAIALAIVGLFIVFTIIRLTAAIFAGIGKRNRDDLYFRNDHSDRFELTPSSVQAALFCYLVIGTVTALLISMRSQVFAGEIASITREQGGAWAGFFLELTEGMKSLIQNSPILGAIIFGVFWPMTLPIILFPTLSISILRVISDSVALLFIIMVVVGLVGALGAKPVYDFVIIIIGVRRS